MNNGSKATSHRFKPINRRVLGSSGAHVSYIESLSKATDFVMDEIKSIPKELPQIKKQLMPYLRQVEPISSFPKVVAVDGSNTRPIEVLRYTGFGYSAACVYDYRDPSVLDSRQKLVGYAGIMDRSEFWHNYPRLLRDREELKLIIRTESKKPDLVLVNGTAIGIAVWNARRGQLGSQSLSGQFDQIFSECYDPLDPKSLYNQVYDLSRKIPVIFLPDASVSRMIIRAYVSRNLPDYIKDIAVLCHILEPGQYLEPIEFGKGLSTGSTTWSAAKYAKGFLVTYIQPPVRGRLPLKIEFHKNHRNRLNQILATILRSYNARAGQPEQLFLAHKRCKRMLPSMESALRIMQIEALEASSTEEEKMEVAVAFSIARLSKRWI